LDALAGGLSGAAQGVGAVAQAAAGALSGTESALLSATSGGLKFAGAAVSQLAPKDAQGRRRITSWTSLAAAGISGALDTLGAIGKGDEALGDLTTARSIADNVRVASTL